MIEVLVVGQTPPPVHGQSVMTAFLLDGAYEKVRFHHVRMGFSSDIAEVGRFKFQKVLHLIATIFRIYVAHIKSGCSVLYYPPAGPKRIAFYRDAAILIATRWLFRRTVFHFYAGGIGNFYGCLSKPERWIYDLAYSKADLGIALYQDGLVDPHRLACRKSVVVECGIPDEFRPYKEISARERETRTKQDELTVTFLAMLSEEKGVLVFLEACAQVLSHGFRIKPVLVGWSESAEFENQMQKMVQELGLQDILVRHDRTVGAAKHQIYRATDIFCFPTFYPSEGSPVVLLEAMQFGLPIVASAWRGCNDTVVDGVTGFLVRPRDVNAVVERLEVLLKDSTLRQEMGVKARARFEQFYTVEKFRTCMEEMLQSLDTGS